MENRIIKFEAWDGDKMVSPDYIDREGVAWWKEDSIPTCSKKVRQFTGLLDCDGKEIYELDIYRLIDEETKKPRIIELNSEGRSRKHGEDSSLFKGVECLGMCLPHEGTIGGTAGFFVSTPKTSMIEVVGNVYENKELLEPLLLRDKGLGRYKKFFEENPELTN